MNQYMLKLSDELITGNRNEVEKRLANCLIGGVVQVAWIHYCYWIVQTRSGHVGAVLVPANVVHYQKDVEQNAKPLSIEQEKKREAGVNDVLWKDEPIQPFAHQVGLVISSKKARI